MNNNNNNNNSNIGKSFKISYIITFVILMINFFLLLLSCFYKINTFLYLTLQIVFLFFSVLLFFLSSFVTFIFGIINFIKNKSKIVRKKIVIMFFSLILSFFMAIFIPVGTRNLIDNFKNKKILNTTELVIKKIKNDAENKLIYFLDDFKEIEPSLDNYIPSSYVTHFDDRVYVCLTDGTNIIEGYENNLKVSKVGLLNKTCNYKFLIHIDENYNAVAVEGEKYLKYFLEKKYNIIIQNVEGVIMSSGGVFSSPYIDHYDIVTNFGTFEAMVEVIDNEIVVTDNIVLPNDYKESETSINQIQ